MECRYVLAMYDVRGKQDFIYRGRKCKEIVGASQIIADVFKDYLFPAAEQYREKISEKDRCQNWPAIYKYEASDEPFSRATFAARIQEGCLGEVVYDGGGNFLILFKDAETCTEITRIFTRNLLREIGTLRVLCTYIEDVNFDAFSIHTSERKGEKKGDRERLYELHRQNEALESVIYPVNTLPFVQVSQTSARPFTEMVEKLPNKKEKGTTEEASKYRKYKEYIESLKEDNNDKNAYLLDDLVYDKGKESLLAVIYIDGNSMGAKVQDCLRRTSGDNGKGTTSAYLQSYEECVTRLRRFSADIHRDYVVDRVAAIDKALSEHYKNDKQKVRRAIVAAGDEMTIICGARDALRVVKAYFKGLPADGSSCAGIAVFHSHAPYADAYRIAEQCCENAKSVMKKAAVEKVNLMDFYYAQGGIGYSLEQIREREVDGNSFSKPWRLDVEKDDVAVSPVFWESDHWDGVSKDESPYHNAVTEMAQQIKKLARTNVKDLRQAAENGQNAFTMECKRITAHQEGEKRPDFSLSKRLKNCLDPKQQRALVYDVACFYDIWFQGEEAN